MRHPLALSTSPAPWHLVAANDKRHARLAVLAHVCARLEAALRRLHVQYLRHDDFGCAAQGLCRAFEGAYPRLDNYGVFAGRKIRLGAYGDPAAAPKVLWEAVVSQAESFTGYTHQWRLVDLQDLCMASCETASERALAKDRGYRTYRITTALETGDGHITVPTTPGLGVTIDREFVAANPSERNVSIATGGWNTGTETESVLVQSRRPRANLFGKSTS